MLSGTVAFPRNWEEQLGQSHPNTGLRQLRRQHVKMDLAQLPTDKVLNKPRLTTETTSIGSTAAYNSGPLRAPSLARWRRRLINCHAQRRPGQGVFADARAARSEERRVGKECRL